jgi:hypothetical protein
LDVEGRGMARRAARGTPIVTRILRTFLDRGGPIPVEDIDTVREALLALDDDDVIRIRDGHIDIAYPFSATPTPFVVRLADGTERYACCATDALGIAPMIGQRVEIRSRCHHCGMAVEFSVTPEEPSVEANGVMLWIGRRADGCKAVDAF